MKRFSESYLGMKSRKFAEIIRKFWNKFEAPVVEVKREFPGGGGGSS